jgi:hypothetical protein
MDAAAAILASLVAGANVKKCGVVSDSLDHAYDALRVLLRTDQTKLHDLEQNPQEEALLGAIALDIRQRGLAEESSVLAAALVFARALIMEAREHIPEGIIEISDIVAARDIVIRDLEAISGVHIHGMTSRMGGISVESSNRRPPRNMSENNEQNRGGVLAPSPPTTGLGLIVSGVSAGGDISIRFGPELARGHDFASRIRRFVGLYMQSEDTPVPFGGRGQALARLDAWLADPSGPRRLLLVAPAGRGKSALLVSWLDALRSGASSLSNDLDIAFVPISIRFETNRPVVFWEALARQLAVFAGEQIAPPASDPAAFYADFAASLIERRENSLRRLLIVVDGIDEAGAPGFHSDLLPSTLPPTVKIALSARVLVGDRDAEGWLIRLDWGRRARVETMTLPLLDEKGISDVLVKLGAPIEEVSKDHRLVVRLAELTQGEPLLVRLYAEELWDRAITGARISREDLDVIKPGLKGYLAHWLRLQEDYWAQAGEPVDRSITDAILAVLAFACAPLEEEVLLEVAHNVLQRELRFGRRVIEQLARLIIGDGSTDRGYVLAHPALAAHLQEDRFAADAAVVRLAFAQMGTALLNRSIHEKAVAFPRCVVLYHASYLTAAERPPNEFIQLTSEAWRGAWLALDGGEQGFVADVYTALRALSRAPAKEVTGHVLRCALVLSSLRSWHNRLPPSVVVACVVAGVMSARQAEEHAALTTDVDAAAEVLTLLNERGLATPNARDFAFNLLPKIQSSARRAALLGSIIPTLADDLFAEALNAADEIRDAGWRARMLLAIACRQGVPASLATLQTAVRATNSILIEAECAKILSELAPMLNTPLLRDALDIAVSLRRDDDRADALRVLAPYLPVSLSDRALYAGFRISSDNDRARAIAALVPRLSRRCLSEAAAFATTLSDFGDRAEILSACAVRLDDELATEQLSGLLQEASTWADPWSPISASRAALATASVFRRVAKDTRRWSPIAAEATQQLQQILKSELFNLNDGLTAALLGLFSADIPRWAVADFLRVSARACGRSNDNIAVSLLVAVAPRLDGEWECQPALATAKRIVHPELRIEALVALTESTFLMCSATPYTEAISAAREIIDPETRAAHLELIVSRLPTGLDESVAREALDAIRTVTNLTARAKALATLAMGLQDTGRAASVLAEALTDGSRIGDEAERAETLVALAACSHEPTVLRAVQEAVKTTFLIGDGLVRAKVVAAIAERLSGASPESMLAAALDAALDLADAEARAKALVTLAPYIPEQSLDRVLDAAQQIPEDESRAQVVSALAPRLPQQLLDAALTVARGIGDEGARMEAVSALAVRLNPVSALNVLPDIERSPEMVSTVLIEAASRSLPSHLVDVISATRMIWDSGVCARTIFKISELAPDDLWEEVVEAACAVFDPFVRADLLCRLLPRLSGPLYSQTCLEALHAIGEIKGGESRAVVISLLASRLPAHLLGTALQVVEAIADIRSRARALTALVPHLSEDLIAPALYMARDVGYRSDSSEPLLELAPRLPTALLPEALDASCELADGASRAAVLSALAPKLRHDMLPHALAAARHIDDVVARSKALTSLAGLDPQASPQVPDEAINGDDGHLIAKGTAGTEHTGLGPMSIIWLAVDQQPGSSNLGVLFNPGSITDVQTNPLGGASIAYDRRFSESILIDSPTNILHNLNERIEMLEYVQQQEPEVAISRAVSLVFSFCQTVDDPVTRSRAFAAVAARVHEPVRSQAVARCISALDDVEDPASRSEALAAVANELPPSASSQAVAAALRTARDIQATAARADVLRGLLPRLPPTLYPDALNAVKETGDLGFRTQLAVTLASVAEDETQGDCIHIAAEGMSALSRPRLLALLRLLLPAVNAQHSAQASAMLLDAIVDVAHWQP